MSNKVEIHYCRLCQWLLRSSWMAQELLTTFAEEIEELSLRPGTGGIFQIYANGELVWDRKRDGGFPDVKQLKRCVRDVIAPERELGHVDSNKA
ncbi:SelT/SelW/SelH family protein [Agaribacterium haliotis]|uniref:SelT/SelW/SelH family protein n=1 Tax=Agaribacterium haliotis TaxID=2013869 RepID=UPI000BB54767|nr:SelT/SelW/SelH family protein [Agaribacterium haliotis]